MNRNLRLEKLIRLVDALNSAEPIPTRYAVYGDYVYEIYPDGQKEDLTLEFNDASKRVFFSELEEDAD